MNKYQCNNDGHNGSLNLIPQCCLIKIVNQRIKLLEFVKTMSNEENSNLDTLFYVYHAKKLLEEIGEE